MVMEHQNDMGAAVPQDEGTYRRGYHQAVNDVAQILRARNLTAEELQAWVDGKGMHWRKDVTLSRIIAPPLIG
jgi:hypothetical protein